MPSMYVLDVPEFAPLLDAAHGAGCETRRVGDYIEVTTDGGRLMLRRGAPDGHLRNAVWFAALTGGFAGRLIRFDAEELWLED